MMTEMMINAKDDGSFKAYVAMPEKTPAPAVIVIQEIFGVNEVMRKKCDWLASQGYIAVCPDLFWRIEPGIDITDQTEEEWERAFELFQIFDVESGIEDLEATREAIKENTECNGSVGCLGYCLGGKLAYLMSTRTPIEASVSYHGVGLDILLHEAENITNPLMMHIAGQDDFVSEDAQQRIMEGLRDNELVTIHHYPEMNHAFTRFGGDHYDEKQAKIADDRSLAFLAENLHKDG